MKCATCAFVACEQLPDTMARKPLAGGSALACADGCSPKLPGSAMATPEPAVTSGRLASAGPSRSRSSLLTASTMAMATPCAFSSSMRARIAHWPAATAR